MLISNVVLSWFPGYFLRRSAWLYLLSKQAGHPSPGVIGTLLRPLALFIGAGALNSCAHACTASDFETELSPDPELFLTRLWSWTWCTVLRWFKENVQATLAIRPNSTFSLMVSVCQWEHGGVCLALWPLLLALYTGPHWRKPLYPYSV